MSWEIQVLAWDRYKNVAGSNWLMGSKPFLFDKLDLQQQYIYKQTIKKKTASTQNDNINIDSTIAGSVNAGS